MKQQLPVDQSPREERGEEEISVLVDDRRRRTSIPIPIPKTKPEPIYAEPVYANVIPFVPDGEVSPPKIPDIIDRPISEDQVIPPLISLDSPKISNVSSSNSTVKKSESSFESEQKSSLVGSKTSLVGSKNITLVGSKSSLVGSDESVRLCPVELANAIKQAQKKMLKVK